MVFILMMVLFAAAGGVSEEFASLDAWRPLTFRKIPAHSTYRTVREDGRTALSLEADRSASGLVYRESVRLADTPVLSWRWKVERHLPDVDPRTKPGDDYPARVYVLFAYDPARAPLSRRAAWSAARLLYGGYPPDSTLVYVYTSSSVTVRRYRSPYTDRAAMVVRRSRADAAGVWYEERADVLADYRAAFGEDPPAEGSLAVMADADNTGASSRAFIDYIRLEARQ